MIQTKARLGQRLPRLTFASLTSGPHRPKRGVQTAPGRPVRRRDAELEDLILRVPGAFQGVDVVVSDLVCVPPDLLYVLLGNVIRKAGAACGRLAERGIHGADGMKDSIPDQLDLGFVPGLHGVTYPRG